MSNGGPGLYGYGWDLPLGRIERSTRHGVIGCGNQDHARDFVLVLPSGTVEFTLQADGSAKVRVQESFVRITYDGGPFGTNTFTVWEKTGLKYTFGGTPESKTGNATAFDEADLSFGYCGGSYVTEVSYTFLWSLTRIEDPNANAVDIEYGKTFSGLVYPERILYGGRTVTDHPFEVDFIWDATNRPLEDRLVNGTGGYGAQLDRFLSAIYVKYLTLGQVVRRYQFAYDFQGPSPRIGRQTFLERVTLFNGAGLALPDALMNAVATVFLYQENGPGERFGFQTTKLSRNYDPTPGPGGRHSSEEGISQLDIFDITGDGIPDWIDAGACNVANRTWEVSRGSKSGFASAPETWTLPASAPCNVHSGYSAGTNPKNTYTTGTTVDITGDGLPDLVNTAV